MDKQKQINEIADIIFEALNKKGRIANGEGVDIISVAIYNAGYRKIPENAVVLTREEKQEYESLVKLLIYDKPINSRVYEFIKDTKDRVRKETAEKFARLVEFHSVATMKDGREYFTISALGLKEILHEEFGIPYDEICKEITEGEKEISNETI